MRVRNPADQAAWAEFVEIYEPLIQRLARIKGLQHCDAEDLSQQVLVSISQAIGDWKPDKSHARFRTWLQRVARNAILNALTRRPVDSPLGQATGGDMQDQPDTTAASKLLDIEHRREVFRWAARHIEPEFQPDTWRAFWDTAVEGRSIDDVAAEQGKQRGAIYAARSRVMKRLQEQVRKHENQKDT